MQAAQADMARASTGARRRASEGRESGAKTCQQAGTHSKVGDLEVVGKTTKQRQQERERRSPSFSLVSRCRAWQLRANVQKREVRRDGERMRMREGEKDKKSSKRERGSLPVYCQPARDLSFPCAVRVSLFLLFSHIGRSFPHVQRDSR